MRIPCHIPARITECAAPLAVTILGLLLGGCGTSIRNRALANPAILALSASPTVLLPGQTSNLTVNAKNVSSSAILLSLKCSAADCGSLAGDVFTAPSTVGTPLSISVTASIKMAGVAPSNVQLTIDPPPSITSITPSSAIAGAASTFIVTGTGFTPDSTILASKLDGVSTSISHIKVLSPTSISFVAAFPLTGPGITAIRVSNQEPASTSALADIYVAPPLIENTGTLPVFNVANYFASGSNNIYHCSGTAGSYTLTCDESSLDFVPNEGIRIISAGLAESNPTEMNQPAAKQMGTSPAGTHTDCYVVYATDPFGGISAPSPRTCLSDEPDLSFMGTYNVFQIPYTLPYTAFLWYVSEDGGPYQLFNVGTENPAEDMGERIGSRGGWTASYSAGSPGITKNDDLFTIVTAVNGNQITLQQPLLSSVTDTEVNHDDTNAIQAAINAAILAGGGVVKLGSGTFNVRRPSFVYWTPTSGAYNYLTTNYKLRVPSQGYFNLYIPDGSTGNIEIEGSGPSTVLQAPPEGTGALLDVGYYSNPAYSPFTVIGIEPIEKGATTLTLANASDAASLHAGDDVWLYTGTYAQSATSSCVNSAGTAGGNCHFSELNTIKSINGSTITLEYPTSKRFYNDGKDSFGMVKLPVTLHNVALQDMTINTYNGVIGGGYVYGLLVNHVALNGSPAGGPFAMGFKRDVVIENSSWGLGEGDATWNGTEEFDQATGVALIDDDITGSSAPGSEGPSEGAKLYFTEGSSQVVIQDCTFSHASVYFQDTTDDVVDGNVFNDSDLAMGDSYNPYPHPQDWGVPQDASFVSFDSQTWSQIDNNTFNIDDSFYPPWILNIGHFTNAQVDGNTINDDSQQQGLVAIDSDGGEINGNTIRFGPDVSSAYGIAAIPDEGPNIPPSGFDIEGNTITGQMIVDGIQVIDSGFTNTAPVCIKNNSINISKGTPMDISESSTNLTCGNVEQ